MCNVTNTCAELHLNLSELERFRFPIDAERIPKNGIYFLYEFGESGHGVDRIVRVGTHTGNDQLRSRLHQHFVIENKDRSIFRKNIGRALLHRDNDPFLAQWEIDLTTRAARDRHGAHIDHAKQRAVEQLVTEYIQKCFSFAVIAVPDKATRLTLESGLLSTISLCKECVPSKGWLGNFSPKEKIRQSGLWNVNELYKTPLDEKNLLLFRAALVRQRTDVYSS